MTRHKVQRLSDESLDAASEWFVEFGEGDVGQAQRQQFVEWLRASPEHVRAYLQVAAHWEDARALRNERSIDELILLTRTTRPNVVPLYGEASPDSTPAGRRMGARKSNRVLAIAASIICVAVMGWFYLRGDTYTTVAGEQRSVRLTDGSLMELNAKSKVHVRFTRDRREVELVEGQALFRVVKDQRRPFDVVTADTRVQAVGTQFDVYRKSSGTTVTVLEGRVKVSSARRSALSAERPSTATARRQGVPDRSADVLLAAGQQLTATPTVVTRPHQADIVAATAWTRRQIAFQSAPLTEVVSEFNRYNTREIVITDPALASIRISGVFSSTDPSSLLRGLETLGKFSIREQTDRVEIAPAQ